MSKALNVAICQINPVLGSFENNLKKIANNYEEAHKLMIEEGGKLGLSHGK